MFYASKNNKVICKETCGFVKKIKQDNLITYNSIEEAEKDGCRKCKRCLKSEIA